MNSLSLEETMRNYEYFHNIKALPNTWVIIRVDGRSFSRLTSSYGFKKPFDEKFHAIMVGVASSLLKEMKGLYAYTESDEISILFSKKWSLFNKKIEKLVSVSAGIASSAFNYFFYDIFQVKKILSLPHFDSRVWCAPKKKDVINYFRWRQDDATRCSINSYAYWTLRKEEGCSKKKATLELKNKGFDFKNELLFKNGINFNEVPLWQRRGTGIYFKEYEKVGFNPIKQENETAIRKALFVNTELPIKDEYSIFIKNIINCK